MMFTAFSGGDAVTDRHGSRRVEDFCRELAATGAGDGGLAVRR